MGIPAVIESRTVLCRPLARSCGGVEALTRPNTPNSLQLDYEFSLSGLQKADFLDLRPCLPDHCSICGRKVYYVALFQNIFLEGNPCSLVH